MFLTSPMTDGRIARRGSALVVVLVVVMMLSLGAYSFTSMMVSEAQASNLYDRDSQARALALSAVEVAAAVLGANGEYTVQDLYHSPELFAGIEVVSSGTAQSTGRYSLIAPVENSETGELRNGMIDESSKWNLNALLSLGLTDDEVTSILQSVPGIDTEIAEAILDWLDDDDEPREYGAEYDYYAGLSPPYAPRNGKLESLDELLKIRGITPELLYGEDANRNGLLDPNENDGEETLPYDNADGVFDLGLSAYLTVHASETNLRMDGSPRINLNQPLLTSLYDTLEEEFGADIATFIVAFRAYGPVEPLSDGGAATTGNMETDEALKTIAEQIAEGLIASGGDTSTTRNGIELSGGSKVTFVSMYELLDAQVQVPDGTSGSTKVLTSPWSSSPGDLAGRWLEVADAFTLQDADTREGRININQARRETLLGIPGMTIELAENIVERRIISVDAANSGAEAGIESTTAWLLAEGLCDLQTLVDLDPFMTTRGSIYRVQALGHYDGGGTVARVEAVIDATQIPPAIISQRDLSELGAGYRSEQLSGDVTK